MPFSCYDRFYMETELDRYLNGQNEAQTVNLKRHSLRLKSVVRELSRLDAQTDIIVNEVNNAYKRIFLFTENEHFRD